MSYYQVDCASVLSYAEDREVIYYLPDNIGRYNIKLIIRAFQKFGLVISFSDM